MRNYLIAAALALLIAIPAALAVAHDDDYPEGDGRLAVFVRNERDAGFVHLRIVDAEGRQAHDERELLPADGGWGVELRVPVGAYHVTLVRSSGIWPFATRITSSATIDLATCADAAATLSFVTSFDGADEGITGPFSDCATGPAGPSAGARVHTR